MPPMAEGPPEPPGAGLQGLIPPSHFTLRPPAPSTSRMLEVERRRSQALGVELEAERRRSHMLGVELEAEKRRSHSLEVELEVERRRSLRLGEELEAERRRGQAKGAGPDGEKLSEETPLLLRAQLSALSHILTLQERELNRELPPPRLQALLGRWRQKVFALLVQLRVQDESQQVQRLAQEVTRERGRAEAAEQALRGLSHAATRLAVVVTRCEDEVTAAIGAMAALSDRLHRAGQRLRVLQGLVAPDRPRWHREAAGETAAVTRGTHRLTGMGAELQHGVSPPCPVVVTSTAGVAPERVTEDGVTQDGIDNEVTSHGDSAGPAHSRVALCSLVAELQAMGAAILGDPP